MDGGKKGKLDEFIVNSFSLRGGPGPGGIVCLAFLTIIDFLSNLNLIDIFRNTTSCCWDENLLSPQGRFLSPFLYVVILSFFFYLLNRMIKRDQYH